MRGALVLGVLAGCSFGLTQAPEPHRPCPTSRLAPIIDAAAGVTLAAISIGIVVHGGDDYAESSDSAYATVAGLGAGLYAIAATRGFGNVDACRDHEIELREEQLAMQRRQAPQSRLDAWQLTQQAQAAARKGDCATVASLNQVVRTTDAELHATVFMRDVAIAHCLAEPASVGQ